MSIQTVYPRPLESAEEVNGYTLYHTEEIKCDCDNPDDYKCRNCADPIFGCRCVCHDFA